MYGDAVFGGPAGGHGPHRYRYLLWRCWETDADQLTFVLCNPSTAGGWEDGAFRSDPTVDRLIEIATRAGAGGFAAGQPGGPRGARPGPPARWRPRGSGQPHPSRARAGPGQPGGGGLGRPAPTRTPAPVGGRPPRRSAVLVPRCQSDLADTDAPAAARAQATGSDAVRADRLLTGVEPTPPARPQRWPPHAAPVSATRVAMCLRHLSKLTNRVGPTPTSPRRRGRVMTTSAVHLRGPRGPQHGGGLRRATGGSSSPGAPAGRRCSKACTTSSASSRSGWAGTSTSATPTSTATGQLRRLHQGSVLQLGLRLGRPGLHHGQRGAAPAVDDHRRTPAGPADPVDLLRDEPLHQPGLLGGLLPGLRRAADPLPPGRTRRRPARRSRSCSRG